MKKYLPILIILSAFIWSCGPSEYITEEYHPTDSHQEYTKALIALDLGKTVMGKMWITAGEPSANPTALSLLPFQERRIFDPAMTGWWDR